LPLERVYRSNHHQYDMEVHKTADDSYLVVKVGPINVGNGHILTRRESKEDAIRAAEQFPKMYAIAQQEGFGLNDEDFVHSDGRKVWISYAFDIDRSEDNFRRLLRGQSD